jgi:hypothetical protein
MYPIIDVQTPGMEPMAGIAPRPGFQRTHRPCPALVQFKKLQQFALNSLILQGILKTSTFSHYASTFFHSSFRIREF